MRRSRYVLIGVVAALTLGAWPALAITKADYVVKANAVCRTANSELKAKAAAYESRATGENAGKGKAQRKVAQPKDVQAFITTVGAPRLEKELAALRALGTPDEGAKEIGAAVDAFERALAEVKKRPREAAYKDPFRAVHKLFEVIGITECGSGSIAEAAK